MPPGAKLRRHTKIPPGPNVKTLRNQNRTHGLMRTPENIRFREAAIAP